MLNRVSQADSETGNCLVALKLAKKHGLCVTRGRCFSTRLQSCDLILKLLHFHNLLKHLLLSKCSCGLGSPNRTQAEQAAPGLLSAIQIFLKTHNKQRLRELELVLVNAAMMGICFIRLLCWPIQTMQLSRCGGFAQKRALVSGTTHANTKD